MQCSPAAVSLIQAKNKKIKTRLIQGKYLKSVSTPAPPFYLFLRWLLKDCVILVQNFLVHTISASVSLFFTSVIIQDYYFFTAHIFGAQPDLTPSLPQPVTFLGRTMHGCACRQSVFRSCNTSTFSAVHFNENPFA